MTDTSGVSSVPTEPRPICAHDFDNMVCVASADHAGPHVTSNERFPHGLRVEKIVRGALHPDPRPTDWLAKLRQQFREYVVPDGGVANVPDNCVVVLRATVEKLLDAAEGRGAPCTHNRRESKP